MIHKIDFTNRKRNKWRDIAKGGILCGFTAFLFVYQLSYAQGPAKIEATAPMCVPVAVTMTPTPSPTITPSPVPEITPVKKYLTPEAFNVRALVLTYMTNHFGVEHETTIHNLLASESGFRPDAVNPSSGACGMFQAMPCEKMQCSLDYSLEAIECQVRWGNDYIERRYGDPTRAWRFWEANQWY